MIRPYPTLLFASALVALNLSVSAQKKELTLEDAVRKRFSHFQPERMQQLQWVKGSSTLSYVEQKDSVSSLMLRPAEGKAKAVLTKATLEKWMGPEVKLGGFPSITWLDADRFQFRKGNTVFQANLKKKTARKVFALPEDAGSVTFNDQRTACAYVKEHNLYILMDAGLTVQVTEDGKEGIVYGQAVHRSEFGITGGLFWSDNGQKLAFYRMDETMVDDYPLVDISDVPASLNQIKYPMAGRTSHEVTLGVYDLNSKKTSFMKTGEPADQYLCSVTWSPDASAIYIALLNRDQDHLVLNRYDASSGEMVKTLFEEKDKEYVEPEHPLWFLPHDNSKFIWMSERDGYQHLYLYDIEGKLIRPLTYGNWEAHEIYGMDVSHRYLYVRGTGEWKIEGRSFNDDRNATQRYTYVIDLKSGSINMINDRKGIHVTELSDKGDHLIEHFTSLETPWETTLYNSQGVKQATLKSSEDPLEGYAIGKAEIGSMVGGGTASERLYYRLIKPSDFDATKKYPVLLYVYGGPHAQLVTHSYLGGAPLWMYWMAEQGYIVATVDNRGSANRGIEFEQITYRELGQQEMIDQKLFLDNLASLPYTDMDRVGIHGWSYGGFMTINMMLNFPGLFKAGVAGGPVCDWKMYEVMYTERYMDTPEDNPDGYEQANLVDKVDKLEDDLLVIHGTVDDVVLWQHSQALLKSAVDNDIQLDYFIYPGHPHNVRGKDRYHLMEKVLNYIDERLKE